MRFARPGLAAAAIILLSPFRASLARVLEP